MLLGAFNLSACGSDDDVAKPDDKKAEEEKAPPVAKSKIAEVEPICPQVAVVRGLDVVRDFGNENPDPAQLVAAARLLKVEGNCEYTDDGVDVAFHVNMTAERGPRLGGLRASFPIFVAVLDPSGAILNKDQMTVDISFPSDEKTANHAEALHVVIPMPKDKHTMGPYYKILAGFQLSPTEAAQAKASLKP
jgi:hypothetical protein